MLDFKTLIKGLLVIGLPYLTYTCLRFGGDSDVIACIVAAGVGVATFIAAIPKNPWREF